MSRWAALGLQPITATGVAVHRTRGGGAPVAALQAELYLRFFTFLTTFANVLTLQVFHHHVQVVSIFTIIFQRLITFSPIVH